MQKLLIALLSVAGCVGVVRAANNVPVPGTCTSQVNQKLSGLLSSGQQSDIYNVMVCGVTTQPSRTQRGGPNGDHQILSLRVAFSDGSTQLIEVVTNDGLDGKVTAPANVQVFAYGRAFFSNIKQYAAGIDDVHCATSRRADNGWVVVSGTKYPNHC